MNFNPIETHDSDEFEITATYGTAVFIIRAEKAVSEGLEGHRSAKGGHLFEHGEYHMRHPKAA